VPIYPVAIHDTDKIIVVYLDHRRMRNKQIYTDEAARTWWMAELKRLSELDTRGKANEVRRGQIASTGPISERRPHLVPREPRLFTSEQFLPIGPRISLGNLLTGTLNFGAKKAQRLLMLGYTDTLLSIEAYGTIDSHSTG
jgi:hypothetical protein